MEKYHIYEISNIEMGSKMTPTFWGCLCWKCVRCYLHKFVEVQLGDTGLINEEAVFGSDQVCVRQTFIGGLQGAENKCSHH